MSLTFARDEGRPKLEPPWVDSIGAATLLGCWLLTGAARAEIGEVDVIAMADGPSEGPRQGKS